MGVVGFDRAGKRTLLRALGKCDLPAVKVLAGSAMLDPISPDVSHISPYLSISPRYLPHLPAVLPMSARLHPVCETPGVNDVLLPCPPRCRELLVGQLLGRCERRALLRHFQLADFATEAEFPAPAPRARGAAVAATGGSDAADGGGTAAAEAAAAAAGAAAPPPAAPPRTCSATGAPARYRSSRHRPRRPRRRRPRRSLSAGDPAGGARRTRSFCALGQRGGRGA